MTAVQQDRPSAGATRGRLTIVFLIHEAFLRDLSRLRDALRAPGVDADRITALAAHWEFVSEHLHHHHRVEDDSLWPLVRPKLADRPEDVAILWDMESQHLTLDPSWKAVETGFASVKRNPSPEAAGELAGRVEGLRVVLAEHLRAEEQYCLPLVDRALTDEEFDSFGKATAKAAGMRGAARFFPWIFDGADSGEREHALRMPPAPVRFLCRYVWEPRYRRMSAALWGR
jgi:hemerythrin-like domain-containing protein